jgi:hypothetical protein
LFDSVNIDSVYVLNFFFLRTGVRVVDLVNGLFGAFCYRYDLHADWSL